MIDGLADWVERVDQLTYDMQGMVNDLNEFQDIASFFGVFVAFAITVIFIMTIRNYAAIRRIENKIDMLMSDEDSE